MPTPLNKLLVFVHIFILYCWQGLSGDTPCFFYLHKRFLFINLPEINKVIMKKVLLLIILFFGSWITYAQDVDSLQVKQPITLDSLAVQVEKMQHDLSYLQCEYELLKMEKYIQTLANEVNTKTNGVLIDVYHMRYDRDCTIDISTPMYSKVISITCNRF